MAVAEERWRTEPRPSFTNYSAVRTAGPATRPPHAFLKFRADSLNVLASRFRFLDGDKPADPPLRASGVISSHFARAAGFRNENLS